MGVALRAHVMKNDHGNACMYVQEILQPLQQMKWFQSRAPTQRDTLALVRHLLGGISLVNVINRFLVCIAKIPQSPVLRATKYSHLNRRMHDVLWRT